MTSTITSTTMSVIDTDFEVHVERGAGGYDVRVRLNGTDHMIGFALHVKGPKTGYTFSGLTLTQFPEPLSSTARDLDWYQSEAQEHGGLSLAEVRKRAAILAGIWLAGQAIAREV